MAAERVWLKRMGLVGLLVLAGVAGCGQLRWAPGETQKQNAYLHHRTVQSAALQARQEEVTEVLRELTTRAQKQSDAIVAYYGLPKELPATDTIDELLSEQNEAVTESARASALQRPDPWDIADNMLELGIAVAGVLGGAAGLKVAGSLQAARQKSVALREVIEGNELFKRENPEFSDAFKQAQAGQSKDTRQMVAVLKN